MMGVLNVAFQNAGQDMPGFLRRLPRQCTKVILALLTLMAPISGICSDHCDEVRKHFYAAQLNRDSGFPHDLSSWLMSNGEHQCALDASLQEIRSDPTSWVANYSAGLASVHLGNLVAADRYLSSAVNIAPSQILSRLALGQLEEETKQDDRAEQTYRSGLAVLPNQPDLLNSLAALLSRQRRYRGAIGLWRVALSQRPGDKSILLSIAVAYSDSGDQGKTAEIAQQILRDQPEFEPALYTLGTAYARGTNFSQAVTAYESALKLDPKDSVAQLALAKVLVTLLRYDDARKVLQDYVSNHPNDAVALFMLGRSDQYLGDLEGAEVYLKRSVAIDPNSYDAEYNLGVSRLSGGKIEEAIDSLTKALGLRPALIEPHFQLSKAYRRAGHTELADEQLAITGRLREVDSNKTRSVVLGNQGNAAFAAGNVDDAIKNYTEAISIEPGNGKLYYDLSLAYRQWGNASGELNALKQAEAIDPSLAIVHNQLGVR